MAAKALAPRRILLRGARQGTTSASTGRSAGVADEDWAAGVAALKTGDGVEAERCFLRALGAEEGVVSEALLRRDLAKSLSIQRKENEALVSLGLALKALEEGPPTTDDERQALCARNRIPVPVGPHTRPRAH